jgi:hypothetical protein
MNRAISLFIKAINIKKMKRKCDLFSDFYHFPGKKDFSKYHDNKISILNMDYYVLP